MPELRRTGRTPHQVAEVRPSACPNCTYRWPKNAPWRVLVGTHKCPDHQHRTYQWENCRHTVYDPKLVEGCREALRMGTPDGGLTE